MTWLLLHGTPLDPECWTPVATRLGGAEPVQVPSIPPRPGDARPQHDLAEALAAGLGAGERDLHVVGHSFGGQVAFELALARPERVRSLTILCSRSTPFPAFAALAAALRAGEPVDVEAGVSRWFSPAEVAADGPVVRYARAALEHADHGTWATALDAIAHYDAHERIGAITAPTTFLAAEHDPVSTPTAMAHDAAALPQSVLEVLPGAGHMSAFVDPERLADRLRTAAARV